MDEPGKQDGRNKRWLTLVCAAVIGMLLIIGINYAIRSTGDWPSDDTVQDDPY